MDTRLTSARRLGPCATELGTLGKTPAIITISTQKRIGFIVLSLDVPRRNAVAWISLVEWIDRIRIVFEDDSIVVVDKPPGLLTMATEAERSKTVYAALRAYLNNKKRPERL